jgi:hypothetical protein
MDSRDLNATHDAWSNTYDETPNPLIEVEEMAVRSTQAEGRGVPWCPRGLGEEVGVRE